MHDLITASKCLSRLKQDGVSFSKSYFSQKVKDGTIPTHKKPPSPKDFYKYDEVKNALETSKDPTRDAQRESNSVDRDTNDLFAPSNIPKSSFADLTPEQKEQYNKRVAEQLALAEEAKQEALNSSGSSNDVSFLDFNDTNLTDAKTAKEYWLGKKAEFEVKRLSGELIEINEVEQKSFETARLIRDRLLSLPNRVAPIVTAMNDEFSVRKYIEEAVIQSLQELTGE